MEEVTIQRVTIQRANGQVQVSVPEYDQRFVDHLASVVPSTSRDYADGVFTFPAEFLDFVTFPDSWKVKDVTSSIRSGVRGLGDAFGDKEYGSWEKAVQTDSTLGDHIDTENPVEVEPMRPYEGRIHAEDLADDPEEVQPVRGRAYQALVDCGGDITVATKKLQLVGDLQSPNLEDEYLAVVNEKTGYVFQTTSDIWDTPQHRDVAQMIDNMLLDLPDLDVECSTYAHSGHVWWKAHVVNFTDEDIINDEVVQRVTDKMPEYRRRVGASGSSWAPEGLDFGVKFLASHSVGGGALHFCYMLDIEACNNLARVGLAGFQGTFKHTKMIRSRVEALTQFWAESNVRTLRLRDMVAKMALAKVDTKTVDALVKKLIPGDSTRAENLQSRLVEIYHDAPGAMPGSAWGLVQMATYYSTHEGGVRVGGRCARKFSLDMPQEERVSSAREFSNLWGAGHNINTKALKFALNLTEA